METAVRRRPQSLLSPYPVRPFRRRFRLVRTASPLRFRRRAPRPATSHPHDPHVRTPSRNPLCARFRVSAVLPGADRPCAPGHRQTAGRPFRLRHIPEPARRHGRLRVPALSRPWPGHALRIRFPGATYGATGGGILPGARSRRGRSRLGHGGRAPGFRPGRDGEDPGSPGAHEKTQGPHRGRLRRQAFPAGRSFGCGLPGTGDPGRPGPPASGPGRGPGLPVFRLCGSQSGSTADFFGILRRHRRPGGACGRRPGLHGALAARAGLVPHPDRGLRASAGQLRLPGPGHQEPAGLAGIRQQGQPSVGFRVPAKPPGIPPGGL
ncbi:basic proline-rich protein precursor [hydrocarbon metagenome]|uniref:Basic proline-rich protein n=1 Tax=hydrocarbon metagenome TaxID=938273 RepID=A0A0W8G6C4_9ZZZZ